MKLIFVGQQASPTEAEYKKPVESFLTPRSGNKPIAIWKPVAEANL